MGTALGITRERHNGKKYFDSGSGLWIGDDGFVAPRILETPRIGISHEEASTWPLRYAVAGSPFLSGPKWLNQS